MEYSRNFGSNFPQSLIPVGTKKDVDDSVSSLISQYYSFCDKGDMNSAAQLYKNNKTLLEPYIVDSAYFNFIEEEIYNIGVGLLNTTKSIISDTEPISQSENSHWLKEF